MCGSLCTCIWRLRLTEEFFNNSPTLFFEVESPSEPRAHGYGYSCSGHHHCKSKWPVLPTQTFHGIWGAELQSYHLHRKLLTTEQSSPNPASCFWVLLDRLVEWVGALFCFLLCSASEIHTYMYNQSTTYC